MKNDDAAELAAKVIAEAHARSTTAATYTLANQVILGNIVAVLATYSPVLFRALDAFVTATVQDRDRESAMGEDVAAAMREIWGNIRSHALAHSTQANKAVEDALGEVTGDPGDKPNSN